MNVACVDGTVVSEVQAVLLQYAVARVREQGPNIGSPMICVMVDSGLGEDKEGAMRREIAQIPGATIRS
jgi:hypothetical protein